MNSEAIYEELVMLCERLSVELRLEPCPGDGGMYNLRGKRVMVVSSGLSKSEAVWLIAGELARIDIEEIFLKPAVREMLDRAKSRRIRPPGEAE
jgi:hypothetical protein